MVQKFQGHPRCLSASIINMDDRFSIASTDLSFVPFSQRNKDISDVMIGVEFHPLWKSID
jgi:hypothetical protein